MQDTGVEARGLGVTAISGVTVKTKDEVLGVAAVRKVRRYTKVSEIVEDVRDGKIVPYKSASEVVDDMKRGILSPSEAMLFISAMYTSSSPKKRRGGNRRKKLDISEIRDLEDDEGCQDVDEPEERAEEDECSPEAGFSRLGEMVDEVEEW